MEQQELFENLYGESPLSKLVNSMKMEDTRSLTAVSPVLVQIGNDTVDLRRADERKRCIERLPSISRRIGCIVSGTPIFSLKDVKCEPSFVSNVLCFDLLTYHETVQRILEFVAKNLNSRTRLDILGLIASILLAHFQEQKVRFLETIDVGTDQCIECQPIIWTE